MKKNILIILTCIAFVLYGGLINAQTNRYWSGNGGSDNMNDGGNWYNPGKPNSGDNLNFDNTSGGHHFCYSDYGAGSYFNFIITYNGSGLFKYYGNTTFANKFENNNSPVSMDIQTTISNRTGPDNDIQINPVGSGGIHILTGGGSINMQNAKNILVYGNNTLTIDVAITESGTAGSGLVLESGNSPTVNLTATNSYTGTTYINGGILKLNASGGALQSGNSVNISGGSLEIIQSQTVGNLTLSSGTLQIDAGQTLTINGTYTPGTGTIINNGKIVLVGPAIFPGVSTTISAMNDLEINRSGGNVV